MLLICRDFVVVYILAMIGLIGLSIAIEAALGTDLSTVLNIIPQIVAAQTAGQRHGRRTGIRPENGFSWKAAGWMTLVSFVLSLIAAGGLIVYMGPGDAAPLWEFLQSQFVLVGTVIAVILVIYVLLSRFFFGLGAKQGAKFSPNTDAEIFR